MNPEDIAQLITEDPDVPGMRALLNHIGVVVDDDILELGKLWRNVVDSEENIRRVADWVIDLRYAASYEDVEREFSEVLAVANTKPIYVSYNESDPEIYCFFGDKKEIIQRLEKSYLSSIDAAKSEGILFSGPLSIEDIKEYGNKYNWAYTSELQLGNTKTIGINGTITIKQPHLIKANTKFSSHIIALGGKDRGKTHILGFTNYGHGNWMVTYTGPLGHKNIASKEQLEDILRLE